MLPPYDFIVLNKIKTLANFPLRLSSWISYSFTSFGEIVLDQEPTRISNVKVTEVLATSAVVSWSTNHLADSKVSCGPTPDYGDDVYSSKKTREHRLKLLNLKPNTIYYYEVMSNGKNYVYDARHEFKTPKEE